MPYKAILPIAVGCDLKEQFGGFFMKCDETYFIQLGHLVIETGMLGGARLTRRRRQILLPVRCRIILAIAAGPYVFSGRFS
jgi:hypothetical protein